MALDSDCTSISEMQSEQQIICEVPHGSPEYWATVALRDALLRKPLGLHYSPEELAAENDSHHIACYRGDRLVGCLILRPQGDAARMRQVAVADDLQGQGIGTAMVQYSEALARRFGFARIVLHARETAAPFYEKLGYSRIGDLFEEVKIPHWAMTKWLGDTRA
jgi:N-acetylglutamate synthase-like GNAT family acetyltransferase